MEQVTIKYGGVSYNRPPLNLEQLTEFGTRIVPKLIGLAGTAGVVSFDKFEAGENVYSFYKVILDVFDKNEWTWLVNLFVNNTTYPLSVEGVQLTPEEIETHFAGDFLKVYVVTLLFAKASLGKFDILKESLTGLAKNIVDSFETLINQQTANVEKNLKKNT